MLDLCDSEETFPKAGLRPWTARRSSLQLRSYRSETVENQKAWLALAENRHADECVTR